MIRSGLRILVLAPLLATPAPAQTAALRGTVQQVIDGDTVVVSLDGSPRAEVVRLLGVDAPEDFAPGAPRQRWAQAARAAVEKLLAGKRVRLEPPPGESRDRYGRLLAYLHTEAGVDVNGLLVRRGLATHFELYPHPRQAEFALLTQQAAAEGRGIYKARTASAPGPATASPAVAVAVAPAAAPAVPAKAAAAVRFYVSSTGKAHRTDCDNRLVQQDMKTERGETYDTWREASGHATSNCKLCRPYLNRPGP